MSKKSKKAKERLRIKKERQKRIFFGVVGGVLAVLVITLVIVLQVTGGDDSSIIDEGKAPEDAKVSSNKEYVYVKVQDINDEKLHFYNYYSSSGKVARYFIVMGSDGKYHASIDLCQKLHPARSGWVQDGPYIICKDEECAYPINAIGSEQPACCWPVTLPFEIVGDEFQIRTADLEEASKYF